ncbi:hypothetical protein TRICHSKD4_0327 [Roseibium sp. TrichSKD4]|nr:hypothetical protein TRICHSKD4_5327 [Roseibium sp. TrichSKD4]EFO34454.1 hypothetical protein TRICHSKD4_0238 [Roseibium sp. TrichSKD4]EFO34542.1 hypothetical protein TRICHSKD4_0327 [Roseibium sp. TrichSKD4]
MNTSPSPLRILNPDKPEGSFVNFVKKYAARNGSQHARLL